MFVSSSAKAEYGQASSEPDGRPVPPEPSLTGHCWCFGRRFERPLAWGFADPRMEELFLTTLVPVQLRVSSVLGAAVFLITASGVPALFDTKLFRRDSVLLTLEGHAGNSTDGGPGHTGHLLTSNDLIASSVVSAEDFPEAVHVRTTLVALNLLNMTLCAAVCAVNLAGLLRPRLRLSYRRREAMVACLLVYQALRHHRDSPPPPPPPPRCPPSLPPSPPPPLPPPPHHHRTTTCTTTSSQYVLVPLNNTWRLGGCIGAAGGGGPPDKVVYHAGRYLVADSRYALLAIIVLTSATHLGSLVRARRAGFVTLAALTASIASAPPPPPSRWSLAPPWAPVAGRSEPPTSIRDLGGRAGTACCSHAELKSGLRGGTAEAMMTVDDLSLFRVPLEMICAAVVVVTPPPPPPPLRTSH